MHIVKLADAVFSDTPGGSRKYAFEVAKQFVENGHTVTFLTTKIHTGLPGNEETSYYNVVRYPSSNPILRQLELKKAFSEVHARHPVDIVVVHFAYAAWSYHMLKLSRKFPTLRIFHGPWDKEAAIERNNGGNLKNRLAFKLMHMVESVSLNDSRRVITLSEFMAKDVQDRFNIPKEKIKTIPGGVDLSVFKPCDKIVARNALGLSRNDFTVLTVRRLARRMGLENLIDAAAIVRKTIPNLRVLIGGKGLLASDLMQRVKKYDLEDCVRLVGFIPDEELPSYYSAADVFVLPTTALEGFGLVILEAFACNTPVLGTPVGAIPEILSRFDPDLVLEASSAEAIAKGIINFYHKNKKRDFRQTVEQHYSWKKIASQLMEEII